MRGNLPGPEGLARRGAAAALHGLSIVSTMDRAARLASAPSPCQRRSREILRQAPCPLLFQEFQKCRFVQNRDPQVLGLLQLRARLRARDDIMRLLRDAAAYLAAARVDRLLCRVARESIERSGQHEG